MREITLVLSIILSYSTTQLTHGAPIELGAAVVTAENWMANLPHQAIERPLSTLAIPGTHDSGTYAITNRSDVSPDFKFGYLIDVIGKEAIARWALTQEADFTKQLEAGVRYFDLRVVNRVKGSRDSSTADFYLAHSLYANRVEGELRAIHNFLVIHPKEVVLLDFNHFYKFDAETDVFRLEMLIENVFTMLLAPYNTTVPSLSHLWKHKQQVICIFARYQYVPIGYPIWPYDAIRSPWPNLVKAKELRNFTEQHYRPGKGDANQFFVYQGILTPNIEFLILHFEKSLKYLALPAGKEMMDWLSNGDLQTGVGGVTIVIVDFAVTEVSNFTNTIYQLNWKSQLSSELSSLSSLRRFLAAFFEAFLFY